MTAQFFPILMSVIAALATILKFRSQLKAEDRRPSSSDGGFKLDGGLVTVSGVTVPQLQAIANALAMQESAKDGAGSKQAK